MLTLYDRYVKACDFCQAVDRPKIRKSLLRWWQGVSDLEVQVAFVETEAEVAEAARDARAAWVAGDARAAWVARDARAAGAARAAWVARDARAAGAARAARAAWAAWAAGDFSYYALAALAQADEHPVAEKWLPFLEAFEAGAWLLFVGEDTLYIATIPEVVKMNDQVRLHCEDGPAFVWRDIARYWWHGFQVPEQVIVKPETLTVSQIEAELNAEVRRVMVERYGHARFIQDAGAWLVDEHPQFGRLWRADAPDDEPLVMLEVKNATLEPDGTRKMYWLRVAPGCQSAQQAAASLWRDENGNPVFADWHDYVPLFES